MSHSSHPPDGGLAFDLRVLLDRRRALGALGLVGAGAVLANCDAFGPPGDAEANTTAKAADGTICIKDPAETNGPFPADGTNTKAGSTVNVLDKAGVIREDIRGSFDGLAATAEGVKLDIVITLVDVAKACAPLEGHVIYIWHCDAKGKYSLYELPESNYLRGGGVTDAKGQVRFTSVFPGCYNGRWPHIHFEVFASAAKAVSGDDSLLISQFALPEAPCKTLYEADPVYAGSVAALAGTSLASDGIFSDNTAEQVAAQALAITGDAATGFSATATVGILGA